MSNTKTILALAGFGAAAYMLWPRKKASATDQPLEPPIDGPGTTDPDPDPDPVIIEDPPPSSLPKPPKSGPGTPKFYPLAQWSTPTSEHGIPLVGSQIVGQGANQIDGVTYFEWRLRRTPITFTCVGELSICKYVFETRGVRRSLWDTLKETQVTTKQKTGGFPYEAPIHLIFEEFRQAHLEDFESEKGLFG